jgi:hypothetical protein
MSLERRVRYDSGGGRIAPQWTAESALSYPRARLTAGLRLSMDPEDVPRAAPRIDGDTVAMASVSHRAPFAGTAFIRAEPNAAAFIRRRGGQLYIWIDGAGVKHVRTRPPRRPVDFRSVAGVSFVLQQGTIPGRARLDPLSGRTTKRCVGPVFVDVPRALVSVVEPPGNPQERCKDDSAPD